MWYYRGTPTPLGAAALYETRVSRQLHSTWSRAEPCGEASSARRSSRGERVYGTRIHVKPVLSHGLDGKDVELLVLRQELRMRLVSRAGLWSPR